MSLWASSSETGTSASFDGTSVSNQAVGQSQSCCRGERACRLKARDNDASSRDFSSKGRFRIRPLKSGTAKQEEGSCLNMSARRREVARRRLQSASEGALRNQDVRRLPGAGIRFDNSECGIVTIVSSCPPHSDRSMRVQNSGLADGRNSSSDVEPTHIRSPSYVRISSR